MFKEIRTYIECQGLVMSLKYVLYYREDSMRNLISVHANELPL